MGTKEATQEFVTVGRRKTATARLGEFRREIVVGVAQIGDGQSTQRLEHRTRPSVGNGLVESAVDALVERSEEHTSELQSH